MVSLLLLFYVFSYFVFSLQLDCPSCSHDCGEVGYLACDGCQCAISCEDWPCVSPRECVLQASSCYSSPCPKMPTCVDLTNVCPEGSPLANEDSPVLCDLYDVKCPLGYSCTKVGRFHSFSVCCLVSSDDGPPPIIPFPPHVTTPSSNDDKECRECEIDGCTVTSCPGHPTAQCVSVECSCEWWYVDKNGHIIVDCFPEDDVAPPPFIFPGLEFDPLSSPASKPSPEVKPISPHGVNQPATTETVTPNDQGSHEDHLGFDDATVHVIIGCIVALLVLFIALLSIKLYFNRKRKPPSAVEEDQMKPLQISNGEKPAA